MFVFGGFTGDKVLNDMFSFDLDQNEWSCIIQNSEDEESKGDVIQPTARMSHAACLDSLFDQKMYIFGGSGIEIGNQNYSDLWEFDCISKTFIEIRQCHKSGVKPTGMYGHSLNSF